MSTQELLLNELLQLEREETAFRLAIAARRKVIIEKLRAGDKLDVQTGNLDIALVPAVVSTNSLIEHDSHDSQKVEPLEFLREMESQVTLLDEEEIEGLSMDIAVYMNSEESDVIASEVSWCWTRESVAAWSNRTEEPVKTDVCGVALSTPQSSDEPATALVTGRGKKRKVYRPPAKGVSRRLSQEEVNMISLQRSKK
ncbi:hypothetical protein HDU77_004324 [Chytriomyces hyalinus]|nr:hypothetical protein HDU77_004324 [Chytriomyces hyalinus]